jgi:hypothetical protein
MPPPDRALDRAGMAVTIADAEALALYEDAIDDLLAGRPHRALIERCLSRAPTFALAIACQALAQPAGSPPGWPPPTAGLTRRERQHLDVVAAVLAGDAARASGLAAEHLVDFPGDRLVAALASGTWPSQGPGGAGEPHGPA